ncbi:MAG: MFS transporter [Chloroflexi bacterium]|nr:MAG: MFS transporter [Chloroflexota bacterium]
MTQAVARPFRADRNLRLMLGFTLVAQFQPHLAIWVVYLTDYRDLSLTQVGIMEAFFWGVKLIAEVPTGAFADRFGRRLTFIVGTIIEGSGILIFALAGNFPLLLLSYVLWSLGFAFRSGNDGAYIYDALAAEGREAEFAQRSGRFGAAVNVAFTLGGIAGAALAAGTSLALATLAGVVPALLAVGVLLVMDEPPRHGQTTHLPYAETLRGAWRVLRERAALRWAILFDVMLVGAASPASFLLVQPFLAHHAVPLAWFGLAYAPSGLAHAAGSIASAPLSRRLGLRRTMAAAAVVVTGGLLLVGMIDSVWMLPALWISQFATGTVSPALGGYINDRTESAVRATVLSVGPVGFSLVLMVAGPLAGIAADAHLGLGFIALALLGGVGSGVAFALWQRADAREARTAIEVRA